MRYGACGHSVCKNCAGYEACRSKCVACRKPWTLCSLEDWEAEVKALKEQLKALAKLGPLYQEKYNNWAKSHKEASHKDRMTKLNELSKEQQKQKPKMDEWQGFAAGVRAPMGWAQKY